MLIESNSYNSTGKKNEHLGDLGNYVVNKIGNILYRFPNTVMIEFYLRGIVMNKAKVQSYTKTMRVGTLTEEPRDWNLSLMRSRGFKLP